MNTLYRVGAGKTVVCEICEEQFPEGTLLVHIIDPWGGRLGECCPECYEQEQDDIWG